jgi:hypothetical protein
MHDDAAPDRMADKPDRELGRSKKKFVGESEVILRSLRNETLKMLEVLRKKRGQLHLVPDRWPAKNDRMTFKKPPPFQSVD